MNKIRIVVTMLLLALAVLAAVWLGEGALAFNSPVSPIYPTPPWWDHTPTTTRPAPEGLPTWTPPDMWPTPYWYDDGPPLPPGETPAPAFVPVSPIFHSPLATPAPVRQMCVAVGHWGQILCYKMP